MLPSTNGRSREEWADLFKAAQNQSCLTLMINLTIKYAAKAPVFSQGLKSTKRPFFVPVGGGRGGRQDNAKEGDMSSS
jgi:hypothetical protein